MSALLFFAEVLMREYIPDYQLEPPVKKEFIPICPVCGKECDTVYLDFEGEVAGCDRCVFMEDAYVYLYEEDD